MNIVEKALKQARAWIATHHMPHKTWAAIDFERHVSNGNLLFACMTLLDLCEERSEAAAFSLLDKLTDLFGDTFPFDSPTAQFEFELVDIVLRDGEWRVKCAWQGEGTVTYEPLSILEDCGALEGIE